MNTRRAVAASVSVVLVITLAPLATATRGAVPALRAHHNTAKRAPNGPPLSSTAISGADEGENNTAGVPSAKGDQLVENGLASPLCRGTVRADLSPTARSNCETSGFVGAQAPTNNYAFDVNINVGALGLSKGGMLSVIQDMFIAPVWSGIEWVVHALVVTLEWGYTLELLGGPAMSGVGRSLREAQASFTEPWLALVFAAASILALYNGLIRRRVADTLGQGLLTLAMTVVGLWIIADPLGTVGAVGRWANQASIGTLGAVAQGSPTNGPRTLADSMRALFGAAVEMPWCYLEFGNVHWCSDPALLDPRLHKAALSLAAAKQVKLACKRGGAPASCGSMRDVTALATEHGDELVREADTNGKLFLAFPANEVERNSVKQASSLLHILCQAEDATKCKGPTAAEAEFRSDAGTFPRMIGVVLIAGGVLGMLMLFGLVALHLLIAALISLFMLLLAPFAVLAPALGESGRAAFGAWLTRLLGAVTSKLLFSFLLGALIAMQRILLSLPLLGWWTQWLLMSACWWVVFLKRRHAIAFLQNGGRQPASPERRSIVGRIGGALENYGSVRHPVRWTRARVNARIAPARPPADEQLRKRGHGEHKHENKGPGGQNPHTPASSEAPASENLSTSWRGATSTPEHDETSTPEHGETRALERGETSAPERHSERPPERRPEPKPGDAQTKRRMTAPASPDTQRTVVSKQAQLVRVREARRTAHAHGDSRRATTLAVRQRRVEGEVVRAQRRLEGELSTAPTTAQSVHGRLDSGQATGSQPGPYLGFANNRAPAVADGVRPAHVGDSQTDPRRMRSRVMDDAREVAEGRKRQLGYGRPPVEEQPS